MGFGLVYAIVGLGIRVGLLLVATTLTVSPVLPGPALMPVRLTLTFVAPVVFSRIVVELPARDASMGPG